MKAQIMQFHSTLNRIAEYLGNVVIQDRQFYGHIEDRQTASEMHQICVTVYFLPFIVERMALQLTQMRQILLAFVVFNCVKHFCRCKVLLTQH